MSFGEILPILPLSAFFPTDAVIENKTTNTIANIVSHSFSKMATLSCINRKSNCLVTAILHCASQPDHWANKRKKFTRTSDRLSEEFNIFIESRVIKREGSFIHSQLQTFLPLTENALTTLRGQLLAEYPHSNRWVTATRTASNSSMPRLSPAADPYASMSSTVATASGTDGLSLSRAIFVFTFICVFLVVKGAHRVLHPMQALVASPKCLHKRCHRYSYVNGRSVLCAVTSS